MLESLRRWLTPALTMLNIGTTARPAAPRIDLDAWSRSEGWVRADESNGQRPIRFRQATPMPRAWRPSDQTEMTGAEYVAMTGAGPGRDRQQSQAGDRDLEGEPLDHDDAGPGVLPKRRPAINWRQSGDGGPVPQARTRRRGGSRG